MLARTLLLSVSSIVALLGAPVCASAPVGQPESEQPEQSAPVVVEQQETELPDMTLRPSTEAPPVAGLRYWARPMQTPEHWLAEARAAGIDAKRVVVVSSTAELLAALASETAIVLRAGHYVLDYNGAELHDLHDLALISLGPEPAVIMQSDCSGAALSFHNVEDLGLYNLAIGHQDEEEYCEGDVLRVVEGRNVLVAGTTLFRGSEGLVLVTVDGLSLRDSVITDCRQQFSTISSSREVLYERVEIAGNLEVLLRGFAISRSSVTLVDSTIADNYPLAWPRPEHRSGVNHLALLFAIDPEGDWGRRFVSSPRALEPDRQRSVVRLQATSVDGELVDKAL
jgi:hypothetical protein